MFGVRVINNNFKRFFNGNVTKRKFSNWFEKNIYIEENAGMREKTPETFQLTPTNCAQILAFVIIPGVFMYDIAVGELTLRDKDRGCYREYGMLPQSPQTFRRMESVQAPVKSEDA